MFSEKGSFVINKTEADSNDSSCYIIFEGLALSARGMQK